MSRWTIFYMLWKNINRYIHLKDKLVLSFKFKHGNGNTPNERNVKEYKTKQNNPSCTKRWKFGKNKTPSDDSREQHKLSMDGAQVACSRRRETEVISNIVKEVTHSPPFFQC